MYVTLNITMMIENSSGLWRTDYWPPVPPALTSYLDWNKNINQVKIVSLIFLGGIGLFHTANPTTLLCSTGAHVGGTPESY